MNIKDEIRDAVKISDLIGKHIKIKRIAANRFLALCPFHNEKTPSFNIRDDRGYFHCFGCGLHGDIFEFYIRFFNLTFQDALKQIADQTGFKLPDIQYNEVENTKNKAIYTILDAAMMSFVKNLDQNTLNYLTKNRKLTPQTIKFFKIGFCSVEPTILLKDLNKTISNDSQILEESGLFYKNLPRFAGRVIIPIFDKRGNVVGFGGRILTDDKTKPKYINSPANDIFKKNEILFNLNNAYISRRSDLIVVEGYFDVIKLHQSGLDNAVAPMGTALTENQLQMLFKTGKTLRFLFDTDEAGKKAAFRVACMALNYIKSDKVCKFINLPSEYKDIDELIDSKGVSNIEEVIFKYEYTIYELIWQNLSRGINFKDPEAISSLENHIIQTINSVQDPILKKNYKAFFQQQIWQSKTGRIKKPAQAIDIQDAFYKLELDILKYILVNLEDFISDTDVLIDFPIAFVDSDLNNKYCQIEDLLTSCPSKISGILELTPNDERRLKAHKNIRIGFEKLYLNHKLALLNKELEGLINKDSEKALFLSREISHLRRLLLPRE